MATSKAIPTPRPLSLKGDKARNWRQFIRDWENYEIATGLDKEEDRIKIATFLTVVGRDAMNVYDDFVFEDDRTYTDVIDKFKTFCIGSTNECYQRYIFNSRQQARGESFDKYLSILRRLVTTCDFGPSEDLLLRDKIVIGIGCDRTRQELLQTPNLTLVKAIEICKSNDKPLNTEADQSRQNFTGKPIKPSMPYEKSSKGGQKSSQKHFSVAKKYNISEHSEKGKSQWIHHCRSCGKSHEKIKQKCFAFGKTCNFCGAKNHFESKCRKKGAHQDSSDSEEDNQKVWVATMKVESLS